MDLPCHCAAVAADAKSSAARDANNARDVVARMMEMERGFGSSVLKECYELNEKSVGVEL